MQVISCAEDCTKIDLEFDSLYRRVCADDNKLAISANLHATEVKRKTNKVEFGENALSFPCTQKCDNEDSHKCDIVIPEEILKRFGQYSACRQFRADAYKKHINITLLSRRSQSGVLIVRPHNEYPQYKFNTSNYMANLWMKLEINGNGNSKSDSILNGAVSSRKSSKQLPLFLARNVPLSSDLMSHRKLTNELRLKRPPGRPFGAVTVEKKEKGNSIKLDKIVNKKAKSSIKRIKRIKSKQQHEKEESNAIADELETDSSLMSLEPPPEFAIGDNDMSDIPDVFRID